MAASRRQPLNDRLGTLAARANCKGFAFEYMTGGRVVVLGDPGPWLCSGMTGGVVYVRQNDDWGLDEPAVRRRLSKAAKVSLRRSTSRTTPRWPSCSAPTGTPSWGPARTRRPTSSSRSSTTPSEHFLAIIPVTQQADPNISTE